MKQSQLLKLAKQFIEEDNLVKLQQLFQEESESIDFLFSERLFDGKNILHFATCENKAEILNFLLKHPLAEDHINDTDEFFNEINDNEIIWEEGNTPLFYAAENFPESRQCIIMLLGIKNIELTIGFIDEYNIDTTLIHEACDIGDIELLKLLVSLDIEGEFINSYDGAGLTPLHTILNAELKYSKKIALTKILLSHKRIDVNAVTTNPTSSFLGTELIADEEGLHEMSYIPRIGTSLVEFAKKLELLEIYELIQAHDEFDKTVEDSNEEQGENEKYDSSSGSEEDTYDSENESSEEADRWDPEDDESIDDLYIDVYFRRYEDVKERLESESKEWDLNQEYDYGQTLLHIATIYSDYEMIALLFSMEEHSKKPIDPNIVDDFGMAPIHYADVKATQYLLAHKNIDIYQKVEEAVDMQDIPLPSEEDILKRNLSYLEMIEHSSDDDFEQLDSVRFKHNSWLYEVEDMAEYFLGKNAIEIALENQDLPKYLALHQIEVKNVRVLSDYKNQEKVLQFIIQDTREKTHVFDFYPYGERAIVKQKTRREEFEKNSLRTVSTSLSEKLRTNLLKGITTEIPENFPARDLIFALIQMNQTILKHSSKKSKTTIERLEHVKSQEQLDGLFKDYLKFTNQKNEKYGLLKLSIGGVNINIRLKPWISHVGNGIIEKIGLYGDEEKKWKDAPENVLTFLIKLTKGDSQKESIIAELLLDFSKNIFEITPELLSKKGIKVSKEEAEYLTRLALLFCVFEVSRRYYSRDNEYYFYVSQQQLLQEWLDKKISLKDVFGKKSNYSFVTEEGLSKNEVKDKVKKKQKKLDDSYTDNIVTNFSNDIENLKKWYPHGKFVLTYKKVLEHMESEKLIEENYKEPISILKFQENKKQKKRKFEDEEDEFLKKSQKLKETSSPEKSTFYQQNTDELKKIKRESLKLVENEKKIGARKITGWNLHDVNDDGNCFYESVAHQLALIEHSFLDNVPRGTEIHDSLRLLVQGSYFSDREWATDREIEKLIKKLDLIVAIVDTRYPEAGYTYRYQNENGEIVNAFEKNQLPDKPIIKIAATGNHFLSVISDPFGTYYKEVLSNNKKIEHRYGLFAEKDSKAKQVLEKALSNDFSLGNAIGKGDCFFDACAQSLNLLKRKVYTAKEIRKACRQYALKLDKKSKEENWIYQRFLKEAEGNDKKAETLYSTYLIDVQFTAEEIKTGTGGAKEFNIQYARWGEPDLDGRIICEVFGVHLHVTELHLLEKENSLLIGHQLIDPNGNSKTIAEEEAVDLYKDSQTLHIANYGKKSHFVPVLSKEIQKIEQTVEKKENFSNAKNMPFFQSNQKQTLEKQDSKNTNDVEDDIDDDIDIDDEIKKGNIKKHN